MADPGWMNDPSDPALARWYDGTGWTEHTMVKTDWRSPEAPPPPVVDDFVPAFGSFAAPGEPILEHTAVAPAAPPPPLQPRSTVARAGDRYKAWPLWGRIAAPAAIVLLLFAAVGAGDDKKQDEVETAPASSVTLDEAVDIAQAAIDSPVPTSTLRSIIRSMCDNEVDDAATAAVSSSDGPLALEDVVDASGEGAAALCAEVAEDNPNLVNDVYGAAVLLQLATTTTVTSPAVTTIVSSAGTSATTNKSTSTTKALITKAPTTTKAPGTTQAPVTTEQPLSTVPSGDAVNPGSFCAPLGSTGFTSTGTPMTCAPTSCEGVPYEQPRWHKLAC